MSTNEVLCKGSGERRAVSEDWRCKGERVLDVPRSKFTEGSTEEKEDFVMHWKLDWKLLNVNKGWLNVLLG